MAESKSAALPLGYAPTPRQVIRNAPHRQQDRRRTLAILEPRSTPIVRAKMGIDQISSGRVREADRPASGRRGLTTGNRFSGKMVIGCHFPAISPSGPFCSGGPITKYLIKILIGEEPESAAIFSLRFPVRQGVPVTGSGVDVLQMQGRAAGCSGLASKVRSGSNPLGDATTSKDH
jgi:hypothetical protein